MPRKLFITEYIFNKCSWRDHINCEAASLDEADLKIHIEICVCECHDRDQTELK